MAPTVETTMTRAVSRDGTEIAYWTSGEGPTAGARPRDDGRPHPLAPAAALPGAVRHRPRHRPARPGRQRRGAALRAGARIRGCRRGGGRGRGGLRADYETIAAALPDAQVIILDGQQHIAIDLIPEAFAGHVLGFLRDQPT